MFQNIVIGIFKFSIVSYPFCALQDSSFYNNLPHKSHAFSDHVHFQITFRDKTRQQ